MPIFRSARLNQLPDQRSASHESSDKYWRESQYIVYETTKIRSSRGTKAKTRLDTYFEHITNSAMQGDTNAIREQAKLRDYMERRDALHPPRVRSECGVDVHKLMEEQAERAHLTSPWVTLAYVLETETLDRAYKQKHGRAPEFRFSKPYWLRFVPDMEHEDRYREALRRLESGDATTTSSTDVGYGKPPVATRWTAGQSGNRSGKRTAETLDDSFAVFRASAIKNVPVIVQGRKTKLTSAAIVTKRLFEKAMKGDPAARRELRTLIIELDKRGMLKPPPPQPKKIRPAWKDDKKLRFMLSQPLLAICALEQRLEMEADHRKVHGPNPNFFEEVEQRRQHYKAVMRELAERFGEIREKKEAAR